FRLRHLFGLSRLLLLGQGSPGSLQPFMRLLEVLPELARLLVTVGCLLELLLLEVEVAEVVMRVGQERIDAQRLAVGMDSEIGLVIVVIREDEIEFIYMRLRIALSFLEQ